MDFIDKKITSNLYPFSRKLRCHIAKGTVNDKQAPQIWDENSNPVEIICV